MQKLVMRYDAPAENSIEGWERQSLPLGNGFFGASVFGIVGCERIQITENSFANPLDAGGLTSFLDIYLETGHGEVQNYERGLQLSDATAFCRYTAGKSAITREAFVSHPHKMLCHRMTSAKADLNVRILAEVPARTQGAGTDRRAEYFVQDGEIAVSGVLHAYKLPYYGKIRVVSDGRILEQGTAISVRGASRIDLFFSCDTGYELKSEIFTQEDNKKKIGGKNPEERVNALFAATKLDYDGLKSAHIADYKALFDRAALTLSHEGWEDTVPQLLSKLRRGEYCPRLLELYFAYGRYLLISSSREDTLPANLQGVWNAHPEAPWSSGYWHNINVQMNYWPAFSTDLAETFEAYRRYNEAFRPEARKIATRFLKRYGLRHSQDENANGWTIGTAATPYMITEPGGHSGPGTGGLTSKLFWDYYDFTRDEQILKDCTYPALREMSVFLMNCTKEYDGRVLAAFSASPEQLIHGYGRPWSQYHQTVGCAFDQQMLWENGSDLIKSADILGTSDAVIREQRRQLDKYAPVSVGAMGQIKEYDEETYYGDIGEYEHRHISHLVGLYPGTCISSDTPAWRDSARISLTKRSDISTGWALAHRLNAWARLGDGDHCEALLKNLLGERTFDNLWDAHPPFQIDGNFGATAGISEMLLQSHESSVKILPALPKSWERGCVRGLVARGNFKFDIDWEQGGAIQVSILSRAGGRLAVEYPGFQSISLTDSKGDGVPFRWEKGCVSFETEKGEAYRIGNISPVCVTAEAEDLQFSPENGLLTWTCRENTQYRIYRACGADYVLLGTATAGEFVLEDFADFPEGVLYKVTAQGENALESGGRLLSLYRMSGLERDRYLRRLRNLNIQLFPDADNTRFEQVYRGIEKRLKNGCQWKAEVL